MAQELATILMCLAQLVHTETGLVAQTQTVWLALKVSTASVVCHILLSAHQALIETPQELRALRWPLRPMAAFLAQRAPTAHYTA